MYSNQHRRKTYCIVHNGCDPLEADAAGLRRRLESSLGLVPVPAKEADILVVMGCTFSRQKEGEFERMLGNACSSPNGRLVVASGCFLTNSFRHPSLEYSRTDSVLELVANRLGKSLLTTSDEESGRRDGAGIVVISEGCYGQCAFCSVRIVRGNHTSRPIPDILADIGRVSAAHRRVKLAGQDVAAYGRDRGQTLWDLLRAITNRYPGLRVELGPMGPQWLIGSTDEDLGLLATPMVAGNVHVPLQSGSDAILRNMRRPYTRNEFEALWKRLCEVGVANISTDLMAGFPAETLDDHERTLSFLRAHKLAFAQIFMYERRPGTEAAEWESLPKHIRMVRTTELIAEYLEAYGTFRGVTLQHLVSHSRHMLFNTNIQFEEDTTDEG